MQYKDMALIGQSVKLSRRDVQEESASTLTTCRVAQDGLMITCRFQQG